MMWFSIRCAKAVPAINLTHHCTFSQVLLEWQTWWGFFPYPSFTLLFLPFITSLSFLLSLKVAGSKVWGRGRSKGKKGRGFNTLPTLFYTESRNHVEPIYCEPSKVVKSNVSNMKHLVLRHMLGIPVTGTLPWALAGLGKVVHGS